MKGWRIGIAVLVGFALVAMACLGIVPGPIVFIGFLLFGWVGYVARVLPQVQVSTSGVATILVCVAGSFVLAHVLSRWLWRESGRASVWRTRWTASLLAIVVLMFVCGIGASGVVHQSVWLAKSDRHMFEYTSRPQVVRIKCASNMRQIGQAVMLYAKDHNAHLPGALGDLLTAELDIGPEVFVCVATDTTKTPGATAPEQAAQLKDHNDYVYHGRGLKMPVADDLPILCEPLGNHNGEGMNILFGNGEVRWMPPEQAAQVMRMAGRMPASGPATTRAGE